MTAPRMTVTCKQCSTRFRGTSASKFCSSKCKALARKDGTTKKYAVKVTGYVQVALHQLNSGMVVSLGERSAKATGALRVGPWRTEALYGEQIGL
jgi:endogenous inhibitor of DNA gyrase (YacG/DUF329 family)